MSGDSYDGPISIEHHEIATDEVKELGWNWPQGQKALPLRAKSVVEVYEWYAEWIEGGIGDVRSGREWYSIPSFKESLLGFTRLNVPLVLVLRFCN